MIDILLRSISSDFTKMRTSRTHDVGRANVVDNLVAASGDALRQARRSVRVESVAVQLEVMGVYFGQGSTKRVPGH